MAEEQGTVMDYPLVGKRFRLKKIKPSPATAATTANTHRHSTLSNKQQSQETTTTNNNNNNALALLFFTICSCGFLSMISAIFYSPNFKVDSAIASPFNISDSHITTNLKITISISNRNIFGPIDFGELTASVFYREQRISSTLKTGNFRLNPWYRKNHKISGRANVGVSSMHLNRSLAVQMAEDWSHGAVNFTLKMNAIAAAYVHEHHWVDISIKCKDFKVGFSENMTTATLLDGSRECNVQFTNDLNMIDIVGAITFLFGLSLVIIVLLYDWCLDKKTQGRKDC